MTFLLPPGIKGLIGKNIIKSILNGGCCIVIRSGSRLLSNLSSSVFLVSFSSSTSFSSTSSHWSLRHNWSIYSVCKYCKTSIINPIFWILFYFESTKGIITNRLWKNLSRIWKSNFVRFSSMVQKPLGKFLQVLSRLFNFQLFTNIKVLSSKQFTSKRWHGDNTVKGFSRCSYSTVFCLPNILFHLNSRYQKWHVTQVGNRNSLEGGPKREIVWKCKTCGSVFRIQKSL